MSGAVLSSAERFGATLVEPADEIHQFGVARDVVAALLLVDGATHQPDAAERGQIWLDE